LPSFMNGIHSSLLLAISSISPLSALINCSLYPSRLLGFGLCPLSNNLKA
jgi:hypothetical protein